MPVKDTWISPDMTEPRTLEPGNSSRSARLWLALLLALLVANLPGWQPPDIPTSQGHYLNVSGDVLAAIHDREFAARADAAPGRPQAATAILPPVSSPPPPRDARPALYRPPHHRGVGTCPLAPCARDPPALNMTA